MMVKEKKDILTLCQKFIGDMKQMKKKYSCIMNAVYSKVSHVTANDADKNYKYRGWGGGAWNGFPGGNVSYLPSIYISIASY